MNQYVVIAFLLCLSVVRADWITTTSSTQDSNCTAPYYATAYILNTCIDESFAGFNRSTIYAYNASTPTVYTIKSYFTTDCSDDASTSEGNFNVCAFGQSTTYSATQPKFSGPLTTYSNGACGGSEAVHLSVQLLNGCLIGNGNVSYNTAYFGGSQCVSQTFNNPFCTGPPVEASRYPQQNCVDNESQAYFTLSGCAINGVYLADSTLSPTFDKTDAAILSIYPYTKCTGTPLATSAFQLTSCDGVGINTKVQGDRIVSTSYDNYNCSGHLISTTDAGLTLNNCTASEDGSGYQIYKAGTFPSSYNGLTFATQDACDNPTITNSATTYSPGCIQNNATTYTSVSCSVVGSRVNYSISSYTNAACTGTPFDTDGESDDACSQSDSQFQRIYCPSTSTTGPTSTPTTGTSAPTTGTSAPTTGTPTAAPTTRPTTGTNAPTTGTSAPTTGTAAPTTRPTSIPTATPTNKPTGAPASSTTGTTSGATGNSTSTGRTTSATAAATATGRTTTNSAAAISASVVCLIVIVAALLI